MGLGLSSKEKKKLKRHQKLLKKDLETERNLLNRERDLLNIENGFSFPPLSSITEELELDNNKPVINYLSNILMPIRSQSILAINSQNTNNRTIKFGWEGFNAMIFESPDWVKTKIWITDEYTFERWVERRDTRYKIYDSMMGYSFQLASNQSIVSIPNSYWTNLSKQFLYYYLIRKFWEFLENSIKSQKIRFREMYPGEEKVCWIFVLTHEIYKSTIPFSMEGLYFDDSLINPVPLFPFRDKDLCMIPIPGSLAVFP